MDRPRRTSKPTQRLIAEDEAPKQTRPAKRTLNLDIRKVEVKEGLVEDILAKPKITTRKTKTGVKKTLHLDLSDVPPSQDKKFRKDWG